MNNPCPRGLTYRMTVASIVLDQEVRKDRLIDKKLDALHRTWSLLGKYAEDGFDNKILNTIMEKKADSILRVTSAADLHELSRPPRPRYIGSKWYISNNSIPEEELICWSLASQHAVLNHEIAMRFRKLFETVYGKDIDDLFEQFGNG